MMKTMSAITATNQNETESERTSGPTVLTSSTSVLFSSRSRNQIRLSEILTPPDTFSRQSQYKSLSHWTFQTCELCVHMNVDCVYVRSIVACMHACAVCKLRMEDNCTCTWVSNNLHEQQIIQTKKATPFCRVAGREKSVKCSYQWVALFLRLLLSYAWD